MAGVEVTDDAFAMPVDFDLSEAWAEITAKLEGRRAGTSAEVTLPHGLVAPPNEVFGARHIEHLDDAGHGRARRRVTSNTPGMLARQLAGWAPEIDVRSPPDVRAELAGIGRHLAGRYSG